MRRFWTEQEEDYLRVSICSKTVKHIAKNLDRTPRAIQNKLTELGIKVSDYRSRIIEDKRSDCWTPAEFRFLKNNAGKITSIEIAKKLKRTVHSVKMKARYHNIVLQINPWLDKDIDLLEDLVNQGMNWKQIANILNRTDNACRRKYAYIFK